jgi:uncharacterized protein YjbI with pentapeptide repeats
MKPVMPNEVKEKLASYIKNQIDISDLIKDFDIRNLDLSGSRIKEFNRPDDDISGVILANSIIGEDGKITNLSRATMRGINCKGTVFKGELMVRKADCSGSCFYGAYMVNMDYKFCNFEHCDFCGAAFTIATPKGMGAKLSDDFFKNLAKYWDVEIIKKPTKEEK